MKFIEAKQLSRAQGIEPGSLRRNARKGREENKMLEGSRLDQRSTPTPPKLPEPRIYKPAIVQLAKELEIDLETVDGTGQNGEVLARDVKRTREALDRNQ